ncbi:flavonoid 3'-monooxygenase CYP75B137-like [Andrographis paniculata]|uniref:flavonoid 3'-monooxygenase CYP75B137-like n=1 Tax=Andrographis paniculata TaxID=175694 RepID=UPI0021E833B0|nr:flavonoid 3'-monooxygenase CYP75B137-like [Andrographis paniculata]
MLSKLVVESFSWSTTTAADQFHQPTAAAAAIVIALLILSLSLCLLLVVRKPSRAAAPGPRGLPLVGNLLSLDPELHTYLAGLAKSYGPIYRLKLGTKTCIVITSPAVAKEVLKDHDTTFANRDVPVVAKECSYGGVDIAWSPYGPDWRMLRKVCVREMLCAKTLDSVYALRRREIRRTINHLFSQSQSQSGSTIDVGEQIFQVVFNVVTNMLWGNTVKGEDEASVVSEFKDVVGQMTALMGMPNFSDFYPVLERFDLQGIRKRMQGLACRFDRIFEAMIDQRKRSKMTGDDDAAAGKESKDFLQFLLQLRDDADSQTTPLTITHLKALLMDMVVGGTDTTANTIEFALAEMMGKPQVLKKAQQELDSVVGKDSIVEETHISKLPYLYSVMKEVLRLHPTLPLLIPHCPSAACTVSGYTIPKGARVFVNVWAIHRDPLIWENPLEFNPERFSDAKLDFSGNDLSYLPFGSGRRICAGIAMGERMFMYSLASLVHSFDWSVPSGQSLDLSEKFGIVLKKKTPLVAVPTPRLPNSSLYE